jgi:hypothetical protein
LTNAGHIATPRNGVGQIGEFAFDDHHVAAQGHQRGIAPAPANAIGHTMYGRLEHVRIP